MTKTLMAVAIAGAFGLPAAANAAAPASVAGDNIAIAQAGGGGDTGASSRQPGVNPPGSVSPGTPRSAATGADRDTGAAGATSRAAFDRLDKNHDGHISRDEANNAAELNTRFTELDRNNDGKLSHDEYDALHAGARGSTGTGAASGAGK